MSLENHHQLTITNSFLLKPSSKQLVRGASSNYKGLLACGTRTFLLAEGSCFSSVIPLEHCIFVCLPKSMDSFARAKKVCPLRKLPTAINNKPLNLTVSRKR